VTACCQRQRLPLPAITVEQQTISFNTTRRNKRRTHIIVFAHTQRLLRDAVMMSCDSFIRLRTLRCCINNQTN
jgi:hypothetical protein